MPPIPPSAGLSWYFCLSYTGFESMAPPELRQSYLGIYQFCSSIGGTLGPALYSIIVQKTNNHRMASNL